MWDKLKKMLQSEAEAAAPSSPAPARQAPIAAGTGSTYVPPDQSAGRKYKVEDFQPAPLEAGKVAGITSKAITGFLDAIAPPPNPYALPGEVVEEAEVDGLADIKLDPIKPRRKRRAPIDFSTPASEPDADGMITIVEEDAQGNQVTRKIRPQTAGEGGAVRLDGEG